MKNKTLIPLIFLMLFGVLSAQNKDLVGSYKGRGGGIFLFPNKMFALYGYMTMIPGTYEVLPDGIVLFKPKKSPLFLVYGNHNKNLKPDEVRIRFANFEDGKNYLQYENGKTFSVFNENPNCLPSRYVHTFSKKEIGNTLTLIADFSNELPLLTQGLKNTARFTLNDNNDFLIWYGERSHYQLDGAGALVEKEGHTCLIFINVGTLEQNQEAVRSIKKQIKKYL